jgi:lysophospholipase L1-like esterase
MRQRRRRFRLLLGLLAVCCALIGAAPGAAHGAGGGVLVVGDSLEVGTSPYLKGLLHGIPLTVDAQTSRPSSTGVQIVGARLVPSDRVIVFDLGTNDDPAQPQALASDLAAVRSLAGDRCIVVATLNRPPYNGVSIDGLNQVVRSFSASSQPAQLVDWHGAALSDPSLIGPDGVHATGSGYAQRAQLVAQGILSCFSGATGEGSAGPGLGATGGGAPQPLRTLAGPSVDWAKLGIPRPSRVHGLLVAGVLEMLAPLRTAVNASLGLLRSV